MMSSTSTSASDLRVIRSGRVGGGDGGSPGEGRSVVSHAYATSPLRLLMPRNHGHAAWIYTSSFGGGLVDGDRVEMNVTVEDGASAFISTQASTKVYRSPRYGAGAELRARVGDDALLVVAPDPVVCFAAARYRQTQLFDLAPTATLVAIDWLSSGRWAAGERWAFREYLAQLTVRVDGTLVVHDALALRADDGDLAARMGRFEVMAIAVLIGVRLREVAVNIVSRINHLPIARRADRLLAATQLDILPRRDDKDVELFPGSLSSRRRESIEAAGCVVRIAGMSVEQVGGTLRELLAFVPTMLGDDPWSRKW